MCVYSVLSYYTILHIPFALSPQGKTATNLSKSTTLKDKESTSGNKVSSTPTTAGMK